AGQLGEARLVLRQPRVLAGPGAQDHLVVDHLQGGVRVVPQARVPGEELLRGDGRARAPAAALLVPQPLDRGDAGLLFTHGPHPRLAGWATRARPAPDWAATP